MSAKQITDETRAWLAANGAVGGAAGTGAAKARPSHVARRAVQIRETRRHMPAGHRLCPVCGGSGHNDFYDHVVCGACKGAGHVPEAKT